MDEKFAIFGKYTLASIVAVVFWGLVYFAFNVMNWKPF